MLVRVGTFNLNNLFSRFNFRAEVDQDPGEDPGGVNLTFEAGSFVARTFKGRLVRAKDPDDTGIIAERIKGAMNADVLAVQEVEHIEILRQFNRDHLGGLYRHIALVEGNDQRLIDVGVLSKLPIGAIVSHQTAVHPDDPDAPVFSRDLLQVEILDAHRNKLFNLYNTHLKSHYVPWNQDQDAGEAYNSRRRRQQAETIARIIGHMERTDARFVLTGDMNDPPDSPALAPMLTVEGHALVNALEHAQETRPAKPEQAGQGPGPQSPVWTHRYNPPGAAPPEYELYDQIWVSEALGSRVKNPMIDRRHKHGGDGSDHDPAWVELDLS